MYSDADLQNIDKAIRITEHSIHQTDLTVYHGTTDVHAPSVVASGPKNMGKGFGGEGLYVTVEGEKHIAEEYASHALQSAGGSQKAQPVVLEGTIKANPSYNVARIRIAPRNTSPNVSNGVFPADWAKNKTLQNYLHKNFDVVEVVGVKEGGYAMGTDKFLVVHERAGKASTQWKAPSLKKAVSVKTPATGVKVKSAVGVGKKLLTLAEVALFAVDVKDKIIEQKTKYPGETIGHQVAAAFADATFNYAAASGLAKLAPVAAGTWGPVVLATSAVIALDTMANMANEVRDYDPEDYRENRDFLKDSMIIYDLSEEHQKLLLEDFDAGGQTSRSFAVSAATVAKPGVCTMVVLHDIKQCFTQTCAAVHDHLSSAVETTIKKIDNHIQSTYGNSTPKPASKKIPTEGSTMPKPKSSLKTPLTAKEKTLFKATIDKWYKKDLSGMEKIDSNLQEKEGEFFHALQDNTIHPQELDLENEEHQRLLKTSLFATGTPKEVSEKCKDLSMEERMEVAAHKAAAQQCQSEDKTDQSAYLEKRAYLWTNRAMLNFQKGKTDYSTEALSEPELIKKVPAAIEKMMSDKPESPKLNLGSTQALFAEKFASCSEPSNPEEFALGLEQYKDVLRLPIDDESKEWITGQAQQYVQKAAPLLGKNKANEMVKQMVDQVEEEKKLAASTVETDTSLKGLASTVLNSLDKIATSGKNLFSLQIATQFVDCATQLKKNEIDEIQAKEHIRGLQRQLDKLNIEVTLSSYTIDPTQGQAVSGAIHQNMLQALQEYLSPLECKDIVFEQYEKEFSKLSKEKDMYQKFKKVNLGFMKHLMAQQRRNIKVLGRLYHRNYKTLQAAANLADGVGQLALSNPYAIALHAAVQFGNSVASYHDAKKEVGLAHLKSALEITGNLLASTMGSIQGNNASLGAIQSQINGLRAWMISNSEFLKTDDYLKILNDALTDAGGNLKELESMLGSVKSLINKLWVQWGDYSDKLFDAKFDKNKPRQRKYEGLMDNTYGDIKELGQDAEKINNDIGKNKGTIEDINEEIAHEEAMNPAKKFIERLWEKYGQKTIRQELQSEGVDVEKLEKDDPEELKELIGQKQLERDITQHLRKEVIKIQEQIAAKYVPYNQLTSHLMDIFGSVNSFLVKQGITHGEKVMPVAQAAVYGFQIFQICKTLNVAFERFFAGGKNVVTKEGKSQYIPSMDLEEIVSFLVNPSSAIVSLVLKALNGFFKSDSPELVAIKSVVEKLDQLVWLCKNMSGDIKKVQAQLADITVQLNDIRVQIDTIQIQNNITHDKLDQLRQDVLDAFDAALLNSDDQQVQVLTITLVNSPTYQAFRQTVLKGELPTTLFDGPITMDGGVGLLILNLKSYIEHASKTAYNGKKRAKAAVPAQLTTMPVLNRGDLYPELMRAKATLTSTESVPNMRMLHFGAQSTLSLLVFCEEYYAKHTPEKRNALFLVVKKSGILSLLSKSLELVRLYTQSLSNPAVIADSVSKYRQVVTKLRERVAATQKAVDAKLQADWENSEKETSEKETEDAHEWYLTPSEEIKTKGKLVLSPRKQKTLEQNPTLLSLLFEHLKMPFTPDKFPKFHEQFRLSTNFEVRRNASDDAVIGITHIPTERICFEFDTYPNKNPFANKSYLGFSFFRYDRKHKLLEDYRTYITGILNKDLKAPSGNAFSNDGMVVAMPHKSNVYDLIPIMLDGAVVSRIEETVLPFNKQADGTWMHVDTQYFLKYQEEKNLYILSLQFVCSPNIESTVDGTKIENTTIPQVYAIIPAEFVTKYFDGYPPKPKDECGRLYISTTLNHMLIDTFGGSGPGTATVLLDEVSSTKRTVHQQFVGLHWLAQQFYTAENIAAYGIRPMIVDEGLLERYQDGLAQALWQTTKTMDPASLTQAAMSALTYEESTLAVSKGEQGTIQHLNEAAIYRRAISDIRANRYLSHPGFQVAAKKETSGEKYATIDKSVFELVVEATAHYQFIFEALRLTTGEVPGTLAKKMASIFSIFPASVLSYLVKTVPLTEDFVGGSDVLFTCQSLTELDALISNLAKQEGLSLQNQLKAHFSLHKNDMMCANALFLETVNKLTKWTQDEGALPKDVAAAVPPSSDLSAEQGSQSALQSIFDDIKWATPTTPTTDTEKSPKSDDKTAQSKAAEKPSGGSTKKQSPWWSNLPFYSFKTHDGKHFWTIDRKKRNTLTATKTENRSKDTWFRLVPSFSCDKKKIMDSQSGIFSCYIQTARGDFLKMVSKGKERFFVSADSPPEKGATSFLVRKHGKDKFTVFLLEKDEQKKPEQTYLRAVSGGGHAIYRDRKKAKNHEKFSIVPVAKLAYALPKSIQANTFFAVKLKTIDGRTLTHQAKVGEIPLLLRNEDKPSGSTTFRMQIATDGTALLLTENDRHVQADAMSRNVRAQSLTPLKLSTLRAEFFHEKGKKEELFVTFKAGNGHRLRDSQPKSSPSRLVADTYVKHKNLDASTKFKVIKLGGMT